MSKVLCVHYAIAEGAPPISEDEIAQLLYSRGLVPPQVDILKFVRVDALPEGPPTEAEIAEMFRRLELAEGDSLDVIRLEINLKPPPDLITAMLFGMLLVGPPPDGIEGYRGCGKPNCPVCGQNGLTETLRQARGSHDEEPDPDVTPTPRVYSVPLPDDDELN